MDYEIRDFKVVKTGGWPRRLLSLLGMRPSSFETQPPSTMLNFSRMLVKDAVDARASQMTIEPRESDQYENELLLSIRFFIRGEPREHTVVPMAFHAPLFRVFRTMARVDGSRRSGSTIVTMRGMPIRLHFTFYPTKHGEGANVRLG